MSADDDVRDFEVDHGVLDYGLRVDVGWRDDVCDVAVYENVAGVEAEDRGFGDAGVGAADPDYVPALVRIHSHGGSWGRGQLGGGGGKGEERAYGSLGTGRLRVSQRGLGFDVICSLPMIRWTSGHIRSRL